MFRSCANDANRKQKCFARARMTQMGNKNVSLVREWRKWETKTFSSCANDANEKQKCFARARMTQMGNKNVSLVREWRKHITKRSWPSYKSNSVNTDMLSNQIIMKREVQSPTPLSYINCSLFVRKVPLRISHWVFNLTNSGLRILDDKCPNPHRIGIFRVCSKP